MIFPADLEARLVRIDTIVERIAECEAYLDKFFPASDGQSVHVGPPKPPGTVQRSESEIALSVAGRIKQRRELKGWRQQDLADITGIARPNIARLESGRRMPKISTLQKIAEALELRMEELID